MIVLLTIITIFLIYPYLCEYTFMFGGNKPKYSDGKSFVYECLIHTYAGDIEIRKVKCIWSGRNPIWCTSPDNEIVAYKV